MVFDDLYELIDAIMLFGGAIASNGTGPTGTTIGIARAESQWSALWWAKTLLELNGIRMHLAVGERTIASKLGYKSHSSLFIGPAYRRWYPDPPGAVTPPDIKLTPKMFAVWLVDAVSRCERSPVRLSAPRLTQEVARGLAAQVRKRGWDCRVVETSCYFGIELPENGQRDGLLNWLDRLVPRAVWDVQASIRN